MTTMYEMAVKGLDVARSAGIVRVRDGHDTWLCWAGDWDAAVESISARESSDEDTAEAYTALCRAVRGPIASINGTSRGDWRPLVQAAYAAELIDADDARAFGVEVQS